MQEKYTQEQINRLFTVGNASVMQRAANIAAKAKNENIRKMISEMGANDSDAYDDFDEDGMDKVVNLYDAVINAAESILELLKMNQGNMKVIGAVITHLEDQMHEAGDEQMVAEIAKAAISAYFKKSF